MCAAGRLYRQPRREGMPVDTRPGIEQHLCGSYTPRAAALAPNALRQKTVSLVCIVETVRQVTGPCLQQRWHELHDHPLPGEFLHCRRLCGFIAA